MTGRGARRYRGLPALRGQSWHATSLDRGLGAGSSVEMPRAGIPPRPAAGGTHMNRSVWIVAALAAAQVGCATVKPITPEIADGLKGKRVAWSVQTKKPDFTAMTAGKAMFGMIGALAMVSAGNEIVKENGVEDPAARKAEELFAALRQKYGLVPAGWVDPGDDDVEKLAARFPNTDLLLDVRTVNWSFGYFPTDWTHYRVNYAMRATLYDLKNKTILVAGGANRMPENGPGMPTYDELLAAKARRLKAELQREAQECFQDIARDTFRLDAAPAPAAAPTAAPAKPAVPAA